MIDLLRRHGEIFACGLLMGCVILFLPATATGSGANRVIPGEFILTFPDVESRAPISEALIRYDQIEAVYEYRLVPSLYLKFSDDLAAPSMSALLDQLPYNAVIEPNQIVRIAIPDDPRFAEQYSLKNTGQQGGLLGADISAMDAWVYTTGSREVLVAVIDTGIDYLHADLAENYVGNVGEQGQDAAGNDKRFNGIDDDQNGFVDDYLGWNFVADNNDPMDDNGFSHGTHCAGVIGAVSNNARGIAGVNWEVGLVAVKFLDAAGTGNLANALKAIEYATEIGAHVTNNSWGGAQPSVALEAAIASANEANSLFVAAAGNQGINTDFHPHYPSAVSVENVVSVAATDRHDQLASFSNYGVKTVHLAAPGVDILSTIRGNDYGSLSGTSMAAPFVAGAAALLLGHFPRDDHLQVRQRLINSADSLTQLNGRTQHGSRLNIGWAVRDDLPPPEVVAEVVQTSQDRQQVAVGWQLLESQHIVRYEVRLADEPILTQQDWQNATKASLLQYEESDGWAQAVLGGLALNFSGYLSVRAIDRTSNLGPLSIPLAIATTPVTVTYRNDAESLAGMQIIGNWGLEYRVDLGKHVFATNPGQNYSPNARYLLTLPSIDTTSNFSSSLYLKHSWQIERGYDFGYIEVRYGDGVWHTLRRVTDRRSWLFEYWPLEAHPNVQLRFRFESDATHEEEGWLISNILVIADE